MRIPDLRMQLARWVFSPLQGVTFADWSRLRQEAGIFIDPAYRPRALATTVASLANSRAARREEALHGDRIRAARVRAPIFILGHYRSGTTYLHNLLARDPGLAVPSYYQVTFPHTFLTTERWGARMGALLAPSRRPYDGVRIGIQEPAEDELALCILTFLSPHLGWHFPSVADRARRYLTLQDAAPADRERWKEALRRFARKLTVRHGRPLVLKSPCHTARVALILEVFPDARFVHIHRDPFAVFQSTRRMEAGVRPLFRYQRCDPDEDRDELILWRFRETYDAFFRDRGSIPEGRLVEISYEELVREPLTTLERIYRRLGLPDFEAARGSARGYLAGLGTYTTTRHAELEPGLRRRIARAWEPYLQELGYAAGGGCASVPSYV